MGDSLLELRPRRCSDSAMKVATLLALVLCASAASAHFRKQASFSFSKTKIEEPEPEPEIPREDPWPVEDPGRDGCDVIYDKDCKKVTVKRPREVCVPPATK